MAAVSSRGNMLSLCGTMDGVERVGMGFLCFCEGISILPLGRPTYLGFLASERLPIRSVSMTISPWKVYFVSGGDTRKRSTLVQLLGKWVNVLLIDACRPPNPTITARVRMTVLARYREAATIPQS